MTKMILKLETFDRERLGIHDGEKVFVDVVAYADNDSGLALVESVSFPVVGGTIVGKCNCGAPEQEFGKPPPVHSEGCATNPRVSTWAMPPTYVWQKNLSPAPE